VKQDLGPVVSLNEFIRRRRKELKLTQMEVAKAVGVQSPDYISLVEMGQRNLDLDRIPRLAELLRVNAVALGKLALRDQYPLLAETICGQSPSKDNIASPAINSAVRKLESLPRDIRQSVVTVINSVYSHWSLGSRNGESNSSEVA
jgi:transcriptional regulator with XRE-family HTH domain